MKIDETTLKTIGTFAGGIAMGSAGIKALTSKDAKKVYAQATALGMRVKDSIIETVTKVQENVNDIVADAETINEERAAENEITD